VDSSTHATLLERLRDAEDPLAWDEFRERYARLIHGYARRRGCGEHTAEEIVQEVMLAVFEKRDVYRYDPARGRFRDWLGAIARNQVARRRRQPGERIRAPGGEGPERFLEPESSEPGPDALWEETFEESLLLVLLAMVRQTTSPRTYQAFELFSLHGLSGAEVARLTGLSRNAVYQARKEVVKRLKELGAAYRDDGRLDARVKRALASVSRETKGGDRMARP
jgi:RNA polymerase sigma-70 factor (ECF subfamily)